MGVAFVRGLEGSDVASQDRVASSLKHYMGYSFPLDRPRPNTGLDSGKLICANTSCRRLLPRSKPARAP